MRPLLRRRDRRHRTGGAAVLAVVVSTVVAWAVLPSAPAHADAPADASAHGLAAQVSPAAPPAIPLPTPELPDCQGEPVPLAPDRGYQSDFTPAPQDPPRLGESPFDPGSQVTVYEWSGLAGYRWHTYADACIQGPGQTLNDTFTSTANLLMSVAVLAVGVVATLADAVYDQTWLEVLDEPVAEVSRATFEGFTEPIFPAVVSIVAIVMIFTINRLRISAALGTLVLVLLASTLAVFAANYPTTVADETDDLTRAAVVSVNSALAGTDSVDPAVATVSPLVDAMLYDRWVAGTLGDTESVTARTYGPVLFEASTLSWAEAELVREDPDGAGAALVQAKQDRWEEAAAAVEQSDPDAYEYLVGNRSEDRIGHALIAFLLIAILPFLAMSLLLVGISYVILRIVIMFLPIVAILALLVRGTLTGVLSLVAAALLNATVFAVGAAVTAYLFGVLLSPDVDIPTLLSILVAFLVSTAMWILLSPYRRLLRLVTSKDAAKYRSIEYARVRGRTQRIVPPPVRRVVPGGTVTAASELGLDDEAESASSSGGPGRRRRPEASAAVAVLPFLLPAPAADRRPVPGRRELVVMAHDGVFVPGGSRDDAAWGPRPRRAETLALTGGPEPSGSTPSAGGPAGRALPAGPSGTATSPVGPAPGGAGGGDTATAWWGGDVPRPPAGPGRASGLRGAPDPGPRGWNAQFAPVVVDGRPTTIVYGRDGSVVERGSGAASGPGGAPGLRPESVIVSRAPAGRS